MLEKSFEVIQESCDENNESEKISILEINQSYKQ